MRENTQTSDLHMSFDFTLCHRIVRTMFLIFCIQAQSESRSLKVSAESFLCDFRNAAVSGEQDSNAPRAPAVLSQSCATGRH